MNLRLIFHRQLFDRRNDTRYKLDGNILERISKDSSECNRVVRPCARNFYFAAEDIYIYMYRSIIMKYNSPFNTFRIYTFKLKQSSQNQTDLLLFSSSCNYIQILQQIVKLKNILISLQSFNRSINDQYVSKLIALKIICLRHIGHSTNSK